MRRLADIRTYPFLMAAYPALALLAANADQVRLEVVLRPLFVSLLLCALLYALLAVIVRRREPAAILTTGWLLLFFAYGHTYAALRQVSFLDASLGRHRYLAFVWIALALGGAAWILRRKEWGSTARVLTWISVVAVVLPLVQVAAYVVETSHLTAERAASGQLSPSASGILPEGQVLRPANGVPLPDIYYIILDGYGRSDTLEQVYDFDNADFLAGLREMGFTVAECSQSNYAQTELSIASSTNLLYLEALGDTYRPGTDNRRPLRPLIRSSAVRRALEALGYRTFAFDTGFTFINLEDADRYLSPGLGNGLSGFELMYLRSTAGLLALDSATVLPEMLAPELHRPQDDHRERVRFTFDELGRLAEEPGPKYVYAHIVSPHDPFVFGADGQAVESPEAGSATAGWEQRAYADQARFVSRRTLEMLDAVLSASERPPVILLQADHGPGWNSPAGRMGILNAYLFPGAPQVVEEDLSPVNSFRVLFNAVFGTSFVRLADISYFSTYTAPYDFNIIQPSCPS